VEILNITSKDMKGEFDSGSLSRGLRYYHDGMVSEFTVKEKRDGLSIDATVAGTYMYRQEIDVSVDKYGIDIDGECSCPVGYNCKHVVAVIYKLKYEYLGKKSTQKSALAEEDKWLNKLIELQKEEAGTLQMDTIPSSGDFLIYRLFMDNYRGNELNFYRAKILKNGTLSKGTKIANDNYMHRYHYYYDYVTALDKSLATELDTISEGYNCEIAFHDEKGMRVLKKLLASGKCFFQNASLPLQYISQKKFLTFQWQEENHISTLRANLSEEEVLLSNTIPPLCINRKENTLYEVESSYNKEMLKLILDAPQVPTKNLSSLVEKVLEKVPDVTFPMPESFEIEEISPTPVAHLYLYGDTSTGTIRHCMQLSFEYDGEYFESYLQGTSQVVSREGKTLRIQRNLDKEASYRQNIESYGFTYSEHPLVKAYVSAVSSTMQDAIERWRIFREEMIPTLIEEGWHVEIDKSFKYNFESIETINLEVSQESEVNDWFEVSFGVEIGGKKLALLPIVSPLLEEYDSVDDLPENLNLEISEGVYVHIESKEIKPILTTIFELFDKQEGDKLILHTYDVHLLDADADIQWKGLKELKELAQKLKDFKGIEKVEPSVNLQAKLREYQSFGLDWLHFLHTFKFGGILADDMGLGKTVQTLAFLQLLKEKGVLHKPSLIIMPTSLIGNWKNEIKKFTPDLTFLELYGADRAENFHLIDQYDIILTTYSLAQRDEEKYLKEHFEYIILDEAQKIKNPNTKLAIAIKHFKSSYKLALSGTPIENHLGELWSIFDFLMCGFLDNLKTFKAFYQVPVEKEYDMKRRALLNKKIAPFILRRTKNEVVQELPPKTEVVKRAVFGTKQAKLYENIRITMESKVREAVKGKGLSRSHITILDALLKLRQVCCDPSLLKVDAVKEVKKSAKLEMFLELIESLHAENKKVLVFSQFTSMLSILENEIKKMKISYTKLTGATCKREEAIENFTKGDANIFLISLKAGGVGLNLVEADTVIHYDPWWNPAVENQATDRAYRIGQDKAVFVYKLIVEDSIEEKILKLQERKKSLQEGIYKNNEEDNSKLNGDELVELLGI